MSASDEMVKITASGNPRKDRDRHTQTETQRAAESNTEGDICDVY